MTDLVRLVKNRLQKWTDLVADVPCLLLIEGDSPQNIARQYSLVPIRRHGSINQRTSFIWPCTFSKTWGVTTNCINTQFWSTSRGTFDKNNFIGVSFNWMVTFTIPWGLTINWNMSSNWNKRVTENVSRLWDGTPKACLETIYLLDLWRLLLSCCKIYLPLTQSRFRKQVNRALWPRAVL